MIVKYKAKEKLNKEFKEYKGEGFASLILEPTVNKIKSFCENEKFAEAVVNQNKTIGELCEEIVKVVTETMEKMRKNPKERKWGMVFSDIDVYKKAADFYIPGADIRFSMEVVLPENETKSDKIIKLSLENFI